MNVALSANGFQEAKSDIISCVINKQTSKFNLTKLTLILL